MKENRKSTINTKNYGEYQVPAAEYTKHASYTMSCTKELLRASVFVILNA